MESDKLALYRVSSSIQDDADEVLVCCVDVGESDITIHAATTDAADAFAERITSSSAFNSLKDNSARVADILNSTYGVMLHSTSSDSLSDDDFAKMIKNLKTTKTIKVG